MQTMEPALAQTLQSPALVVQSRTDERAVLFYRHYRGTAVSDKWLCVVVTYLSDDAFVLTAYLTDRPKKGKGLWPSE